MADATTDNVEKVTDGTTKPDETPKTVSLTAYQKLQRRNAELASQLAAGAINNSSARVEELLQEVVGLLGDEGKPIKERFIQRKQTETQIAAKFAKINALMENYEGDFETEPKFVDARAARDAGKWDEAIALTEAATKVQPVDIDALVDSKVTAKLKELGKVDTGTTTVTSVGPTDLSSLSKVDTRRMSQVQLKEHEGKLDAAYFKATGAHLS